MKLIINCLSLGTNQTIEVNNYYDMIKKIAEIMNSPENNIVCWTNNIKNNKKTKKYTKKLFKDDKYCLWNCENLNNDLKKNNLNDIFFEEQIINVQYKNMKGGELITLAFLFIMFVAIIVVIIFVIIVGSRLLLKFLIFSDRNRNRRKRNTRKNYFIGNDGYTYSKKHYFTDNKGNIYNRQYYFIGSDKRIYNKQNYFIGNDGRIKPKQYYFDNNYANKFNQRDINNLNDKYFIITQRIYRER